MPTPRRNHPLDLRRGIYVPPSPRPLAVGEPDENVTHPYRAISQGVGMATVEGQQGKALALGMQGVAVCRSPFARAFAMGGYGRACVGEYGIAYAGPHGAARAGEGGVLCFEHFEAGDDWFGGGYYTVVVAHVGKDEIKPDTWYMVDNDGSIQEVDPSIRD